jgi:acylphosphatase
VTTSPVARSRFVVRGLVQGVNFRNEAARQATKRHITGRVWNRDDGAVELVAEGDPAALDDLARWLHGGPRLARVETVERASLDGERLYREFAVSDEPSAQA